MSLIEGIFGKKIITIEEALYADKFFDRKGLTIEQKRESDLNTFQKLDQEGKLKDFIEKFNINKPFMNRFGSANGYIWVFGVTEEKDTDKASILMDTLWRFQIIPFKYQKRKLIDVPQHTHAINVYSDSMNPNPKEFREVFTNKILPACPYVKDAYSSFTEGNFLLAWRLHQNSQLLEQRH